MIVRLATTVADGLKGHPLGLALVVINVVFIVAALYFLNMLAAGAGRSREQLMKDNAAQFDALLKLCAPRYGKWEP